MRKIFLLMLVAMFAAVSCQKSELTTQNGSGDEVTVNISAVMQSDNATTRAIDANGKASQINRCIMEIYTTDSEELYQRQVTSVDASLKASFSINLVPDKTYDFVFWADYSEDGSSDKHYTTTSLKEITADYSGYDGNDEKRDAFFATVNQNITASASNVEAKLYRPFGQVNVSTYVKDLIESYLPTTVQVTYTSSNIATTFNAFDGTTSGSTDFAWEEAVGVIETVAVGETLYHLSTDYIFAPKEGQALIDFKMEFFNDGASIMTNDKFTSIPVQRNYRTNISGNLLTIGSDITVEVVPTFNESDIEVEITTVETVAEVSDVLAVVQSGDDANVTVTGTVSGDSDDNHITVPNSNDNTSETSITVTFEDVDTGAAISFGGDTKDDDSEYDGTVYINAPEGVEFTDLTINLPNAHIVFNGEAQNVDVASDELTFVVAEGAKIGTLTVSAGNVEIYGSVDEILFKEGNDDSFINLWTVYTDAQFTKAIAALEAGRLNSIALGDDITISSTIDVNNALAIDGGNNYAITMDADGQFVVAGNVTMTNVNIAATSAAGFGAIQIAGDNVVLTLNNSTIEQKNSGTSAADTKAIDAAGGYNNVEIYLNNSNIKLNGTSGYMCGIDMSGTEEKTGSSVNLLNSSIISDCDPTSTDHFGALSAYDIALLIGKQTDFELNMENSEIAGQFYPIYLSIYGPTITANIKNSKITGWCAIYQQGGANCTYNITDGSVLTSKNYLTSDSNGFSTIIIGTAVSSIPSGTSHPSGTTINVVDSELVAENYGTQQQSVIDLRMYSTNSTIKIDGNSHLSYVEGADCTDENFVLIDSYYPASDDDGVKSITRGLDVTTSITSTQGNKVIRFASDLLGSGTEDDPYLIYDAADLKLVRHRSNSSTSYNYFKQVKDIEYDFIDSFSQVARSGAGTGNTTYGVTATFYGVYDGCGFNINNFYYTNNTQTNVGLFENVDKGAIVRNMNLTQSDDTKGGVVISTTSNSYKCIGTIAGAVGIGTIENCSSEISITYDGTGSGTACGGVVGSIYTSNITSNIVAIDGCTYSGTINSSAGAASGILGGLAGFSGSKAKSVTITDCTFSGSVTGVNAFGIVNDNISSKATTYTESGNTSIGTVTSTADTE